MRYNPVHRSYIAIVLYASPQRKPLQYQCVFSGNHEKQDALVSVYPLLKTHALDGYADYPLL